MKDTELVHGAHTRSERGYRLVAEVPPAAVRQLQAEVPGLHPLVARLLLQRGCRNYAQVRSFMNPGMAAYGTEVPLKDEHRAAKRLAEAVQRGEHILLYGDYDVDGTCSVAMMHLFLEQVGASVSYYLPDRHREGYGVSAEGLSHACEKGARVLLTMDCGISASEKLNAAQAAGMDVIICDHHLPPPELPQVYAILNPKQADCPSEYKELCGCGVSFMLLRSCAERYFNTVHWKHYLPLVAVATCCDIVEMRGLNRDLVAEGLKYLNENPPLPLRALLQVARHEGEVQVSDLVFKIGPRINAAGRMSHARKAVALLLARNEPEALRAAMELDALNAERRSCDQQGSAHALRLLQAADPKGRRYTNVVHHPDWHKGVIGIMASRIIEQRYKPTVVFSGAGEVLTGSARSVEGFDLYEALCDCRSQLLKFGGHASAAGMSLQKAELQAFGEAFERAVARRMPEAPQEPPLTVDLACALDEWYTEKWKTFGAQLARLGPFGPGHMQPVLLSRGLRTAQVRVLGAGHLSFRAHPLAEPQRSVEVIAFGMERHYEALNSGKSFAMAYVPEFRQEGVRLEARAIFTP